MGDFDALFRDGKEAFEQKKVRTAIRLFEEAKADKPEDDELLKMINTCVFDLNKIEDHFKEGLAAREANDTPAAFDRYIELIKLIDPSDMTSEELEFTGWVNHKEKLRLLREASGYQILGDPYRALGVLDTFMTRYPQDNEMGPFAEQLREAIPGLEAKRRRNFIIFGVVLPVFLLLVIFIALGAYKSSMDQKQRAAEIAEVVGFLDAAFVEIPAGEFAMGSTDGADDQKPVHNVKIDAFQMQLTEMPQWIWHMVSGDNPSINRSEDRPVDNVSFEDVHAFIALLNEMDPKANYKLPSESQWEYACRAGSPYKFYIGDNLTDLEDVAWFGEFEGARTYPVGLQTANAFGLYDMLGNVWEWCEDWYHPDYNGAPGTDISWTEPRGQERVVRGGSVMTEMERCTVSTRNNLREDTKAADLGFRLVRIPVVE